MTECRSNTDASAAGMRWVGWTVLACAVSAPDDARSQSLPAVPTSAVHVGVERRESRLRWSVGPSREWALSEVDFATLVTYETRVTVLHVVRGLGSGRLFALGEGAWGRVMSGLARDSDFRESGTVESSRSVSEVTGVDGWSTRLGVGWGGPVSVGPLQSARITLGWERERRSLRMQNGVQLILEGLRRTDLSGLDSRYHAAWSGLWVAVESTMGILGGALTGEATARVRGRYSGEGAWNLRPDLAQPTSFTHAADGRGYEVGLSYHTFLSPGVRADVGVRYAGRRASRGTDTTFFSDGREARLTFREAVLRDAGLWAGLSVGVR